MTSSMTPSARTASDGWSREMRSRRLRPSPSDRSASRTTTGWAQLPPTQPSIEPSGWTIPCAPGRAEVGRRTATTVATTNGLALGNQLGGPAIDLQPRAARRPGSGHPLLVEDGPDLLGRDRDVDVADAQVPQRIDHRVGDRRRGADRGRLADALGADRVVRRRRDGLADLPGRASRPPSGAGSP